MRKWIYEKEESDYDEKKKTFLGYSNDFDYVFWGNGCVINRCQSSKNIRGTGTRRVSW